MRHPAVLVLLLVLIGCSSEQLGQSSDSPPAEPETFLPGLVSTGLSERDGSFSPDGGTFYFTLWSDGNGMIVFTEKMHGGWTRPETAPFSGRYSDLEASVSPDGTRLFFASNRPVPPDTAAGAYGIWVVQDEDGWGSPSPIGAPVDTVGNEFFPSVASDGTLYFTAERGGGLGGEDIWRSRYRDGAYQQPENMGAAVNTESDEFNAFVVPDQSLLVFSSFGRDDGLGGGDLYISFQDEHGLWSKAVNMGDKVNSGALDYCPSVLPDGTAFLFSSRRTDLGEVPDLPRSYDALVTALQSPENGQGDIYWMSASVLMRD